MSEGANGETKALVDESVLKRTVQAVPREEWGVGGQLLSLTLATVADDLPAWGTSPYVRDRMLREFWPTESILAGTIYSISIRNAAMDLSFEGAPRTVQAVQALFNGANLGKGQLDFFTKLAAIDELPDAVDFHLACLKTLAPELRGLETVLHRASGLGRIADAARISARHVQVARDIGIQRIHVDIAVRGQARSESPCLNTGREYIAVNARHAEESTGAMQIGIDWRSGGGFVTRTAFLCLFN